MATVSDPEFLDPAESTSSEMDSDQLVSPRAEAPRLHSAVPEGADGCDVLMTMPKVLRRYTRKIAREKPVREDSLTSCLSRSAVHKRVLPPGPLDDALDTPIEYLALKENRRIKYAFSRIILFRSFISRPNHHRRVTLLARGVLQRGRQGHYNLDKIQNFNPTISLRTADGAFESGLAQNIGEQATLSRRSI